MQQETPLGDQKNHRMFKLMKDALQKAKTLKKQAIFLIGEIRSGKSTTYNWLSNPEVLIGGDNDIDPIYLLNQKHLKEKTYAEIKNSLQSVTLIPNIKQIIGGEAVLVDLPGNKDRRSQVEVMMVSFILSSCFKYPQKVKFIIVISDNGFRATDGTQFINAISCFVRIFSSTSINDQQLDAIFNSASILITAVPIVPGKQVQTKQYYIRRLKQYIPKLKELQTTYIDLNSIFPLVLKLIQSIISKGRMELFPKAIFGEQPKPAKILQNLWQCGWRSVDLRPFYEHLIFPYAANFRELKEYQQQALLERIRQKMYQYDTLARILSSFIQKFVQNPLSIDDSTFQSQYREFNNYIRQLTEQEQEGQQGEEDYCQDNYSSIMIVKNLLRLNHFTFEISFDQDRDQQSKQKEGYFAYLKTYFIQTLQTLKQSFAKTQKNKRIFDKAISIFGEGFEYFTFIYRVEDSIKYQAHQRMKQATCIMNGPNYNDFDIKRAYFNRLSEESLSKQQFQIEEMNEMIKFVEGQKVEDYEIGLIYNVLYKLYQIVGQKYRLERDCKSALSSFLYSLLNIIKIGCLYSYSIQLQRENQQELTPKIIDLREVQESLFRDIKEIIYEVDPPKQAQFLEAYCKFCDNNNYIEDTIFVINKIVNNKQIKSNPQWKEKIKKYKERKQELQKLSQVHRHQKDLQTLYNERKYLSIINFLLSIFFDAISEITYEEIQQATRQLYKANIQHQQIKNQFNLDLPPHLTNYQILAFSRHLISKIKKRKTIILLGNKAGKSTSCYWLRGKELIMRGSCIYLPSNSKEPNKIIESLLNHTEVPNIYNISENELLVDCPHIYEKDSEKMIIAGLVTKQIIENSQACKFMLVIKEKDILENEGKEFLKMIIAYNSMWDIQTLKECESLKADIIKGLTILVTFKSKPRIGFLRQALKQLEKLFQKKQNSQLIEEKYKLEVDEATQERIYKIINRILFKGLYKYLDLEDSQYKKKAKMVETFSEDWQYIAAPPQGTFLNLKNFFPFHHLKQPQIKRFLQAVQTNVNAIIDLGRAVENIVRQSVYQYSENKIILRNQKMQQNLLSVMGKKMQQIESEVEKNKQLKVLLYPNLSQVKLIDNPAVRHLIICQSLNKLIQITSQLSSCLFQSGKQPFFTLCLRSLDEAVTFLVTDRHTTHLYEACRLKAYQMFEMWKLHQIAAQGQYNYQVMGQRIIMVQSYEIVNNVDWDLIKSLWIKLLDLESLRAQANKKQALEYLYKLLNNLTQNIDYFNNQTLTRKIDEIFLFFLQYSQDDAQCVDILLKQAKTSILIANNQINNSQASNYSQNELQCKLISIIEKIVVRNASVNIGAAFQLAASYGDSKTTAKMFQRGLEVAKPHEKRDTLIHYLEWSISEGQRQSQIMEVLTRYQHVLEQQEVQSYKQRVLNGLWQSRYSTAEPQPHTLQQLKDYIVQIEIILQNRTIPDNEA